MAHGSNARLAEARTPGGRHLTLNREDGFLVMRIEGTLLMSNAVCYSEQRMVEVGCGGLGERDGARVLVGGLGMGYCLRAVLDGVSATSRVVVAELLEAVVEWNRGPLADLAGRPLEDPRVQVEVADIADYLAAGPEPFDAILLDTDNGPEALTEPGNARLYEPMGLAQLHRCLRPRGTLVVWSSYQSPPFEKALRRAGFEARSEMARSRGKKGVRHTLFVGRRR